MIIGQESLPYCPAKKLSIRTWYAFGYTLDFLTSLKHNGFEINYNYDGQGRTKEIQIAGLTYLSKEYPSLNEEVIKYGNNVTYRYISDEDKLLQVYYKEKDAPELLILQNIYDIYGNLIYTEDKINKETHKFFVDEFGKTNKKELSQHGISVEIQDVYDKNHSKVNTSTLRFSSTPSSTMNYEYKYNNSPNPKLESISLSIETENNLNQVFEEIVNYDNLGRPSTIANNNFKKEISYLKNRDHASTLVSKLNFANNDIINDQLAYKYDEKGNIVEIRKNNQLLVNYYYDSISRLIREDNKEFNKTNIFVYDGGGNIIERKEFDFTIATNLENEKCKTYKFHYPINGWRDQLKFYSYEEISTENGSEIISTVKRKFDYDMLGNPEIYKGYNLKWTHGRQLEAFDFVENNEAYKARAKYKYNHEGIRIQKILDENIIKCQCENCSCENCNPYKIDFYLDGSKILKQKDSCNELTFYYGIDGITGFHIKSSNAKYKNEPLDHDFFYKKNAQNDIISIYSSTGDMICEYIYDAWGNQKIKYANSSGKLVAIEDTFEYNDTSEINRFIAFKNPFRYRSYYFDFETGLYYLNSRYYDPQIGRFVNADTLSALDVNSLSLNGMNLFAYALNNPLAFVDHTGTIPFANSVIQNLVNGTIWELVPDSTWASLLGNISITQTTEIFSSDELGFFYSYHNTNIGSSNSVTGGVGINAWGWFRLDLSYYASDGHYGVAVGLQLTPWFHAGISLGTDGIGFNIGLNIGDTSYDLNIKIGWGLILAVATAVVAVFTGGFAAIGAAIVYAFNWLIGLFA